MTILLVSDKHYKLCVSNFMLTYFSTYTCLRIRWLITHSNTVSVSILWEDNSRHFYSEHTQ